MNNINCPLCKSERTEKIKDLPKAFITQALEHFYDEPIPDVDILDYSLHRCSECELEFILPEVSGTERFYTWVTHQPSYYPTFRWEWDIVKNAVTKQNKNSTILDVGCGTGDFFKHMHKHGINNLLGIDTSEPAIKVANVRGFNALCGNIYNDEFVRKNINAQGYDFVVSFHCLEHVENPLRFCKQMLDFVKPGGKLFVSTPYSPMSYESMWYDPLNHPPHHLTRWNLKAYTKLAAILGAEMKVHTPEAAKPLQRTREAINFHLDGFRSFYSRKKLYTFILKNPNIFLKELQMQKQRITINNKVVGNGILVELTK